MHVSAALIWPLVRLMPVKSICGTLLLSSKPDALARFYADALGLSFEREEHAGLAPHRGVGLVASFSDPEGNQFEIVELTYQFEGGLPG